MIVTKECKHGTLSFYENDFWIGGALARTGEYSPDEVTKLCSMLSASSVVIEVGANIGAITVPLAKVAGSVHAYEPQPEIAALLKKNVAQNNLREIVDVFDCACGDLNGEMGITRYDPEAYRGNSGAASLVGQRPDGESQHRVLVMRLDDQYPSERIDLLKIDVEGSELAVIQGARELIKRTQPILYVENDRPEKSVALIREIESLGYNLYWHLPEVFDPDPMRKGNRVISANMLCLHKGKIYPAAYTADCRPVRSAHSDYGLELLRMDEAKAKPPAKAVISNSWACVVRLGGVGDNIIASCVFPHLKKKYGHLEVICAEPQNVIFENNPYIDKLTVLKPGEPKWDDGHKWQEHWLARAREYAFFANLSHSCESHVALTRVQTSYYWGANVRRKICGQNYLEAVADICDVPYSEIAPGFFPTDLELQEAQETKDLVGGRYVAWVMSGTRYDKVWPATGVAVARIIKELQIPVMLMGAPGKDFEAAKLVGDFVRKANGSERDLHLACSVDPARPNWPVRRILTQTQLADAVVTPDTGPGWACAMEPMRKIVMLSHASPENITKGWKNTVTLHADASRVPCWPCHLLIDSGDDCARLSGANGGIGAPCIMDIPPDRVVEEVRAALIQQTPLRLAAE